MTVVLLYCFLLYVITCESYIINNNTVRYNKILAKNKNIENEKQSPSPEKNLFPKIGLGALIQLVTMGAGAPSLGEFKRWEGTKAIFELEANNLVDKEGNSLQTKAKYFLDGYVEAEGEKPPGFLDNLLSGGKKMEEWSERIEQKKGKK